MMWSRAAATIGRVRADARRNIGRLLEAAKEVFATSGVDAPVRKIAEKAGVGVGTVYRHFPQRSDLIARFSAAKSTPAQMPRRSWRPSMNLVRRWLDGCSDTLISSRPNAVWPRRCTREIRHIESLPVYFQEKLRPALRGLLEAASKAGKVRADIDPAELLLAVARLCAPNDQGGITEQSRRMVALLVDGLRYRAPTPLPGSSTV